MSINQKLLPSREKDKMILKKNLRVRICVIFVYFSIDEPIRKTLSYLNNKILISSKIVLMTILNLGFCII